MPRSPYPHPLVAREGWLFVGVALAVAIALSAMSLWVAALLAWLLVVFVVQFFRDPPRRIPPQPNAVLSPADGRIVTVGTARDPYLDRDALKISVCTAGGVDVTCVQIAGLIARRILCYVKPGDTLSRGQRYGFIRFGSRVDVYLPTAATPRVAVGDSVYATETILAELPGA